MNSSLKSLIQLALIAIIFSGLGFWLARPSALAWFFRVVLPCGGIGLWIMLDRYCARPGKAPDYLARFSGAYLERDGLCFVPVPSARNGICYISIAYQNRYALECHAVIVLRPKAGFFGLFAPDVADVILHVQCDGAACGVAHIPVALRKRLQGKRVIFEVTANTTYPGGHGELVRPREGMRAGLERKIGIDGRSAGIMLVVSDVRTRVTLTMPRDVAETVPANVPTEWEIIDPGTQVALGFPVIMPAPTPPAAK